MFQPLLTSWVSLVPFVMNIHPAKKAWHIDTQDHRRLSAYITNLTMNVILGGMLLLCKMVVIEFSPPVPAVTQFARLTADRGGLLPSV
jgi:hypothetical protein